MHQEKTCANVSQDLEKNYNCEIAFQYLLHAWKDNGDRGEITIGVFFDFNQTFATITIDILINKLHAYNIEGVVLAGFTIT